MTEVASPPVITTTTIVSETVDTEPLPVSSVLVSQVESNGVEAKTTSNGTNGTATNGQTPTKKSKEPKPAKVELPPKDPVEDPIGWLNQQKKRVTHKINYHLLDWSNKVAVEEDAKRQPLPGTENKVKKSEFMTYLQDGTVLAQLANKLAPGSVEGGVHEGEALKEKANQVLNVQNFINFAKQKAGLPEDQVFTVEDLQEKGKAGYEAVFGTLFKIGLQAQEKFNQVALDANWIVKEEAKHTPNWLQKFLGRLPFKVPFVSDKQLAQQNGGIEKEAAEGATSPPADAAPLIVAAAAEEEQVNKTELAPPASATLASESTTAN